MMILTYPDKRLHVRCKPVKLIDAEVKREIVMMLRELKKIDKWYFTTCGLAANQIGIMKRLVVVKHWWSYVVMVNPKIVGGQFPLWSMEVCKSCPHIGATKWRKFRVIVAYQDLKGKEQRLTLYWLSAFTLQQEMDHLDGKLIVD